MYVNGSSPYEETYIGDYVKVIKGGIYLLMGPQNAISAVLPYFSVHIMQNALNGDVAQKENREIYMLENMLDLSKNMPALWIESGRDWNNGAKQNCASVFLRASQDGLCFAS